ncbi:MAG: hypothetical protein KGM99_15015, partial [Burkholderiales bacterium]|nr:hypothetical protein [Burkholderiales bacterium]
MWSDIKKIGGAFLIAFCGSQLGRQISGDGSFLMVGFALGLIWLAQSPIAVLRQRVSELERQFQALNESHTPPDDDAARN